MSELPALFLNEDHYQHPLKYLINNSIGKPLLCFLCALKCLRNEDELSWRKQHFLGTIKYVLGQKDNELYESIILTENKNIAQEFIDTILYLVGVENQPALSTVAEECLILIVQCLRGNSYYLECYLTENLLKQLLNSENESCLTFLRIVRKLTNHFPQIIDYLIKLSQVVNGKFARKLLNFLSSSEAFQENAVNIILKIISHRASASEMGNIFTGFETDLSKAILTIFKTSRNEALLLNSLTIFKTLACTDSVSMSVWLVHGTLPSAISSLMQIPNSVIQANVAQCVAHLLTVSSRNDYSLHSFLEEDFPGLLFDTLKTPDIPLIGTVIRCANLLVNHSDFYNQNNAVYWLTPVVIAASFCLERKQWDNCCDALQLISTLMDSISGFGWGIGNVSNFELFRKLILDGLSCDNAPTVNLIAYLFSKSLSTRHLPTPIPLSKLIQPIVSCSKWLENGLKHLLTDSTGQSGNGYYFNIDKDSQVSKLHTHELSKLEILFALLENTFRLTEACDSNPILSEMTYASPDTGYKIDGSPQQTPISVTELFESAFEGLKTFAIPCFCSAISNTSVPVLTLPFLKCLLAAFEADKQNDYDKATILGPLLIRGSFLNFIWRAREFDSDSIPIEDDQRVTLLEITNELLRIVLWFTVKIYFELAPDRDTSLAMIDRGALNLPDSFEHIIPKLENDSPYSSSLSNSDNEELRLTNRSVQFFYLIHYYFALKLDPRESIPNCRLISVVSNYIQSNVNDLHRISVTFQRVLIYLVATASNRSLEDTDSMTDSNISEAGLVLLKSISTQNVGHLLECDNTLLKWCFSNKEICSRLGETMVKIWLENCGQDFDNNSISLGEILSTNEYCQQEVWNIYISGDEALIKTLVTFLTHLSKDKHNSEMVVKIGQSLLRVVPYYWTKDINDSAKNSLLSSLVQLRLKHEIIDTVDLELNIIFHVCNMGTRKQTPDLKVLETCFCYLKSALDSTHNLCNSNRGVAYLITNEKLFTLLQKLINEKVPEEILIAIIELLVRVDTQIRHYRLPVGNLKPVRIEWRLANEWLTIKGDSWKLTKTTLNFFDNYFRCKSCTSVYDIASNNAREFFGVVPKLNKDLLWTYTKLLNIICKKHILYDVDALELFESMTQFAKNNPELYEYFSKNPSLKFLRELRPNEPKLQLKNS